MAILGVMPVKVTERQALRQFTTADADELLALHGGRPSLWPRWSLRAGARGLGYGSEGARALIAWAFTELGVSQIAATTMAVNPASRRMPDADG